MEIKLLGPIEISVNEVSIVPSASKPRQVLALLAIRRSQIVQTSSLVDELWDERPPRSASTTLQTYILQLRNGLAKTGNARCSPKDLLATCYGGYRLLTEEANSDLQKFEILASAGTDAKDAGDYKTASERYAQALALWRGPTLVDVKCGRLLSVEAVGIDEKRRHVLGQRIDMDLHLGRHSALLAELCMLAAECPMDEDLCARLMLAFYRSGNAWRAMEAYHRTRRALVDGLGVEPSIPLRRLHQAILSNDPGLNGPQDDLTWLVG
ncbi:BTAD domain-containing putative transcriptional regulator [Nocardia sp. NBC_01388]|uniref:AfsR/SARP family transcriptional regulator n=1 Tax=Nocardia sp. NBC_01388 TaxID=2903596 RepID=UPI003249411E